MTKQWGAAPSDWQHFSETLGLTADLLPVVSNPTAQISPSSKMAALGKTPSIYNRDGHVAGIPKWTLFSASASDIERWSTRPDYGICLQARNNQAFDIDVGDPTLAQAIQDHIEMFTGQLPCRTRNNSGKRLLVVRIAAKLAKRSFKTNGGVVEFLADGQQYIVAGTHPSGARYEWLPTLPDDIPPLLESEFETLWESLVAEFAIEAPTTTNLATRPLVARKAGDVDDPTVDYLEAHGHVRSWSTDGRVNITCPWQHEHSMDSGDTETQYFPAGVGGMAQGHFKCLHAHCSGRGDSDFNIALGITASEFDVIEETPQEIAAAVAKKQRFQPIQAGEYSHGDHPGWIIKNVLPRAGMVMFYGESGAGKSFAILDIVGAIARGVPWRGHKTKPGRVVYIAAEGAGGVRKRLLAYAQKNKINLADIDLHVIPNAPNLLLIDDTRDLCLAIGKADVVVIDTLAQTTPGGDENAGKDMGKALAHCKRIHAHTGAVVVIVHHSGKDATKGARGWSGLRAAADAEFEVLRLATGRILRASKQKDGEDGQKWGFDLEVLVVGMDEDGDPVTSCAISEVEVTFGGATSLVPKGPVEQAIVEALDIIAEFQTQGIDTEAIVLGATKRLPDPEPGKRDSRRQNVLRSLKKICFEESSPWQMSEDGLTLDIV